ncbi:hypothetical protein REPUB_Repub13aG0009700 [Reevesia pubescens]
MLKMEITKLRAIVVHRHIPGSAQSLYVEAVTLLHQELVGFVNSLAFAKSGQFLVAGVGQEPRLGRWGRLPTAKNGVAIQPLRLLFLCCREAKHVAVGAVVDYGPATPRRVESNMCIEICREGWGGGGWGLGMSANVYAYIPFADDRTS